MQYTNVLHNGFSTWFSLGNTAKTIHTTKDWKECYTDREKYNETLLDINVDDDHKALLWIMLHHYERKISNEEKISLVKTLVETPTLEAFQSKLLYGKGGHTGGVSGLTYNMMAVWPDKIVMLMHQALCRMQIERHTPDWWKMRWLVPIPKKPNPELKDLRPLMMVEVLRKAWYSFAVKKIWIFLEKNKLLQINQFAYRKDREGPMAQIMMVAVLEEAAETESSIVAMSWDEVHGFDNVTSNTSKISMVAKGIPAEQADHLADLDKNGYVYVRTPLAHHTWATEMAQNPHLTMAEIRGKTKTYYMCYAIKE